MDIIWLLFSFSGRLNRMPYWIVSTVISLLFIVIQFAAGEGHETEEVNVPVLIASAILVWPALAVQAKRWHDTNRSAWWILSGLIPVFGAFWVLFVCGLSKGTEGDNDFGQDPLA